jgi:hypothetical protein
VSIALSSSFAEKGSTVMSDIDDLPDDEGDGEEGSVGGEALPSLVPHFGNEKKKPISRLIEQGQGNDTASPIVDYDEKLYSDEIDSPPAKVPDGHGHPLANGYTIVEWDDGFFYLYDENGNLVEGERFTSESRAEDRANELKPPGYRR